MSTNLGTATHNSARMLEQLWVRYQMNVAALRPALGPLFNAAGRGRRAHTFISGEQPPELAVRASMGATQDQPNGIPDVFRMISGGTYSGRIVSVGAASTILIMLDNGIQEFARQLGGACGAAMAAGDDLPFIAGKGPVKASAIIWAGANNVRHVDEWYTTSASFLNPRTKRERELRAKQEVSMRPIAAALGVDLPIVENVAYEVFHLLTMVNEDQGSYDRLELHMLRVGQDLVQRAGLAGAPIGVTATDVVPRALVKDNEVIISDGVARSASAVEDVAHLFNVRPLDG